MKKIFSLYLLFIVMSGCGGRSEDENRLFARFSSEEGPAGIVLLTVDTEPKAQVSVLGVQAETDSKGLAILKLPRSKLQEGKQGVSVLVRSGKKSNSWTVTVKRPPLPSPKIDMNPFEGSVAVANARSPSWLGDKELHFDRELKTKLTITSEPGSTFTIAGKAHTLDSTGVASVTVDISKSFWEWPLWAVERPQVEQAWIPIEWTLTTKSGEQRASKILIKPRRLVASLMHTVKNGGIPTPSWANSRGKGGGILLWSRPSSKHQSVQVVNSKAKLKNLRVVAFGKSHKTRIKKCGPYTNVKTGKTTFMDMELDDATIEAYVRETGKLKSKKTFTARGRCPSGLAKNEGISYSVRIDKLYKGWFRGLVR